MQPQSPPAPRPEPLNLSRVFIERPVATVLLAAAVVIDAVARLQEGALNDAESAAQDSFEADGLLDCPHYTHPASHALGEVPAVLRSGDHAAIARWRRQQSLGRTWLRRPELLDETQLSKTDRALLEAFRQEHQANLSGSVEN